MKIAILGTRGIPNNYGGFEQFTEYLSVGLVLRGHDVVVYNPHFHPYDESHYKGVSIVRAWCPESVIGSAAHFIYDYLCLKDALTHNFDAILECGYQSSSVSFYLCRHNKPVLVTNMDGLEWKRDKWGFLTRKMTRWFERLGANKSHALVADNVGIQEYLATTYGKSSYCIPYGADVVHEFDKTALDQYGLNVGEYFLLIARLEPENNIVPILDGYVLSGSNLPFIVIGNHKTKFGRELVARYVGKNVRFVGGLYSFDALNALRVNAGMYFHGHSVGGTNPSLLEAMAASAYICAHDNVFNRSVLGLDAHYFQHDTDVAGIIRDKSGDAIHRAGCIESNLAKIERQYSWDNIIDQYESCFVDVVGGN